LPAGFREHSRLLGVHGQRRTELAHRLRLDLDELELPAPDVVDVAREWLERSRDLAREFRVRTLADVIGHGLAAETHRGFPSRINEALFVDWFREGGLLQDLEPRNLRLPEPYGAASFWRALVQFGYAFRGAAATSKQPFVIAHDPYGLDAWAVGFVFAGLLGSGSFSKRQLDLSLAHAVETRRAAARIELFASRWCALAVTLRGRALSSYDRLLKDFPELAHEALGCELAPELALSLPRLRVDDAQRFCGWALARARLDTLQESHDEDWFRNPRAIDQIRSEAELSPATRVSSDDLRAGLTRSFAELSSVLGA
jgi:hypothetical protein